ncbi:NACHT domain-containing protein [Fusarium keratoplasticum]|nr:NACHT domain-containing protein [Fusarium keratoplasticum]
MAPGFSKWASKIKKKVLGSDSEDESASKQPSTAQSTTSGHATSSSAATPTRVTGVIAQPEATSTTQPAAPSTVQTPASPAAPSANPQSTQPTVSSTAPSTTFSTTQPAVSSVTQPATQSTPTTSSNEPAAHLPAQMPASLTFRPVASQPLQPPISSTAHLPGSPTPQPVASPPTQSTIPPVPLTTATPSVPQSLPEQLWKKAYESLKDKEHDRVKAYEEVLSKYKKEWADTATSPTVPDLEHCKSVESAEMWKLVYAGLDRSKKQAEFKGVVGDVLGTVEKIKGIVDKAVKYSPEASTIWAGVSLGLEILANPVTEPGINRKGIAYVLTRIEWYWNLADIVLSKDLASSSSAKLRKNLESHVVDLYKKLLLFQMRSVCLYDRNGISVILRDSVKLDDWADEIKEVKDAEAHIEKDLIQFTGQDMRAKLNEIRDIDWSQEKAFRDEVRRLQKREQDKDDQECLVDLLLTDPQRDKERIQAIRGSPLWGSYHWILEHPGYDKFTNDASSRALWIKGDPGKGKTMLICGIIDHLDRSTDPLSYFFCQATEKDQSSDTAVMRGLIYMILDHYPSLMSKLRVEYDKKKKKLFEGPNTNLLLEKVLTEILQDPILQDAIFIIDALDECKTGRSNLVKLIVKLSSSCRAKWIVSSRDWPEIKEEFRGIRGLVPIPLEDEENKKKVAQAVQSYIRTKVDDLAQNWGDDKNYSKGKKKDLKETVYDYMVSHAEDTFLWVALVCQRLAESDVPRRRVEEELRKFPKGLPDLYKLMMDRILTSSESDRLKAVLAAACLAYGHLKSNDMIDFVDLMAGYDEMDVKDTIGSCGSFLTYQDGAVYFIHQSAKEYLLKEGSGHIFPHRVEHQHLQMTRRCLETLECGLKENIYGLSSYGTLIGEFTRPNPDPLSPLEYSCLHWARHLVESAACRKDVKIADQVMHFLQNKFTFWLEALSLLGQLPVAVKATIDIESALGPVEARDLFEFLQDARRFVRYHKAAIEIAPRQVYASALVFSPRCSKVRERFQKQIPKWIVSGPDMQDDWDPCIQTISASPYLFVRSVACSPDGQLFAAACGYGAKVYDATSGECVYTLEFMNYVHVVCVAFSPCGGKLAAATESQVRILQVDTFECIQTLTDAEPYLTKEECGLFASLQMAVSS